MTTITLTRRDAAITVATLYLSGHDAAAAELLVLFNDRGLRVTPAQVIPLLYELAAPGKPRLDLVARLAIQSVEEARQALGSDAVAEIAGEAQQATHRTDGLPTADELAERIAVAFLLKDRQAQAAAEALLDELYPRAPQCSLVAQAMRRLDTRALAEEAAQEAMFIEDLLEDVDLGDLDLAA